MELTVGKKKATSGSLKESTYTSNSPTESSWIMTEACPPSEKMAVTSFVSSCGPPSWTHKTPLWTFLRSLSEPGDCHQITEMTSGQNGFLYALQPLSKWHNGARKWSLTQFIKILVEMLHNNVFEVKTQQSLLMFSYKHFFLNRSV